MRGVAGSILWAPVAACLLLCLPVAGCRGSDSAQPAAAAPQKPAPQTKMNAAREELEQIPPPAKGRYLSVHTTEGWSNPFLIVGSRTLTLRIYYPDAVANGTLPGGMLPNAMLRPAGARKRELDLRLADLPEALSSLPAESWGYGRVVAIEEDPTTLRPDRVQMRRNVETAIQMLNDLGVVVNEWPQGGSLR